MFVVVSKKGSEREEIKVKTIVVIGANGYVGREVITQLLGRGDKVIAVLKNAEQYLEFERWAKGEFHPHGDMLRAFGWSVTIDETALRSGLDNVLREGEDIDGFVYTAGHCPAGGVVDQVSKPLHHKYPLELTDELDLHAVGFHRAMLGLGPILPPGAGVVVISSAITELPDEKCPSFLQAGIYAAAKAAQDELVKWRRRNSLIRGGEIYISLLKPTALDTPFHFGQFKPPYVIPLPAFGQEVLAALDSPVPITKLIRQP